MNYQQQLLNAGVPAYLAARSGQILEAQASNPLDLSLPKGDRAVLAAATRWVKPVQPAIRG